ncbi:MAG: phage terminase large subunit family protein [Aquabacterium sp.]|nr:phage terminase large subunit family protein [Aquabacterium sp.]
MNADGFIEVMRAAAQGVEPDPELLLDRWSEDHVVLPKGSAFAGPYRLSHTPYARRVLQALSPSSRTTRVVVMAASQMLKTQVFINAALGWIDRAPANILALEPTDKLAKRLSARVGKAIDACDTVRAKVARPRSRDARNTIDCKEFEGGAIYITTAGAAANLAEIPARYVFCDEVDRMEVSVNGEGDPGELAEARATTYEGLAKLYHVSSPTFLGASKIHSLYMRGTRETYHVPCPHCSHLHELVIENFRYPRGDDDDAAAIDRAWFVCPECGAEIDERHKAIMLPDAALGGQARWVASGQGDGETISVHLSAFYAPLGSISWLRLARQHAQAKARQAQGDPSAMQVFFNTRLGLPFDAADNSSTAQELAARAEPYPPRVVPERALVVTMFADTQPNRLEVLVEAWGEGLEHWVLDHQVLWGSPTDHPEQQGSVWRQLDDLRRTPWPHASGALIYASAYGIDTGGANTQDVYNYAAGAERMGCLATKGASQRGKPVLATAPTRQDIDWQGRRVPEGVRLWMIGTDTAKDHIANRLRLVSGPGAMHWHDKLGLDFFEQLTAERPHTKWHKGRAIREWIKPNGARNEVLDCAVGNLAVAHYLGLHKWSALDWRRLRARLIPADLTPDLFARAAEAAPVVAGNQGGADQRPAGLPGPVPLPATPAAAQAPTPVPVAPAQARAARRTYSRGLST